VGKAPVLCVAAALVALSACGKSRRSDDDGSRAGGAGGHPGEAAPRWAGMPASLSGGDSGTAIDALELGVTRDDEGLVPPLGSVVVRRARQNGEHTHPPTHRTARSFGRCHDSAMPRAEGRRVDAPIATCDSCRMRRVAWLVGITGSASRAALPSPPARTIRPVALVRMEVSGAIPRRTKSLRR
jgi:hypothetical protein